MSLFAMRPVVHYETPGAPGGGGTAPAVPAATAPAAPAAPAGPPVPPAAPPATGAAGAAPQKPSFEEWVQDPVNAEYTKRLRQEAASNRVKANTAGIEALRPLAQLLGVDLPAGEQQNDPAAIYKQFQERDAKREAEVRTLKIDNQLKDLYAKHGVDAELTKGQLLMNGVLDGLDPDKAESRALLDSTIKKLAEAKPNLKVVQTAPPARRTSAPMPPNGDAKPQLTLEEVRKMKPEDVNKAREAGQLDEILGRIPKS